MKLDDISPDDLRALRAGMTKCSRWEGGHDHAAASNAPMPDPQEILTDVIGFEQWVKAINKRRN